MDSRTIELLFALLRSAILRNQLQEQKIKLYNEDRLQSLITFAKLHNVAHLVVYALKYNSLLPQEDKAVRKELVGAVCCYEQLHYEYEELCNIFQSLRMPYIPLKGAIMRKYYPEPWMRTSCDIDILVKEDKVEEVANHLVKKYGYIRDKKSIYDISLFSDTGIHLELHYNLVENDTKEEVSNVLKGVWNTAIEDKENTYLLQMTDEMFYFYHIAHMAKHFVHGGCGIRPFIDLWILDTMGGVHQNKRDELLKQGDMLKFAENARLLSRVWFENEEHTETTQQMEQFILRGGIYGTNDNRIVIQQQKKGGRFKYALSKIFIPYDVIKFHYPVLQKYKWLTPIMEIRRWFKLAFCGHAKRVIKELKYNNNIQQEEAERIQVLLNNIGL